MEVHHKPKPWHGWREFLKEYVIVVVGVLTALAAGRLPSGCTSAPMWPTRGKRSDPKSL
jgi:hypothetical protein